MAQVDDLLLGLLTDPVVQQDPLPTYAALHEGGPVQRAENGAWVIVGHEAAHEVMRHPDLGRHTADMEHSFGVDPARRAARNVTPSMLFLNAPDHTRVRSLVNRAFTPRRINALDERISALVEIELEMIAQASGPVDLMTGLAFRLPAAVISEMVGVPDADHAKVRSLVQQTTVFLELAPDPAEIKAGEVAGEELREFIGELVKEKRSDPGDDLLSALISAEQDGDRLSPDEVIANTLLLYAAGFETTSNLIGNGTLALLRNPEQIERLRREPSLVPNAVEEILRFDSPVAFNARAALAEASVVGLDLEWGTTLIVVQGAANHDPAVFTNPSAFDVGRREAGVLSFGFGAHHCLGAALARSEGRLVFEGLLNRFEKWELVGPDVPVFRPRMTLRGLESLLVSYA